MSKNVLNLVKLCVGAENVTDLANWQSSKASGSETRRHITRMWPKREKELLSGGSIYWVFKGLILARQKILGFEEIIGADNIRRCGLLLDKEIYRTYPQPRRAFQGWRYLKKEDAPKDIGKFLQTDGELPHALEIELSRLGVY
tara:strand:- start:212 stop:640 length:429 start_codon:yes stop_codon:yes gene_type:complete